MNYPFNFDCGIFFNSQSKAADPLPHSDTNSNQTSTLFLQQKAKNSIDIEYERKNVFLEQPEPSLGNINKKVFLDASLNPQCLLASTSEGNSSPQNLIETLSMYSGSNSSRTSSCFNDYKIYSTLREEDTSKPFFDDGDALQISHLRNNLPHPKTKGKIRRKAWQPQEDVQLLKLVEEYGTKWSKIATMMKGRTGKQIRDRYLNNLNPEILEKEWTKEEDNLILFLYYNWGKKWSKIAAALPGRSEGQVKNRFHWGLKRKILNSQFADYNPVHLVTHKNMKGVEDIGEGALIPKIDINSIVPKLTQGVYFDYLVNENNSEQKINKVPKPQDQNPSPDDFISYNNNPNERIDLTKFLQNLSEN